MTIGITGATGFLGAHLLARILDEDTAPVIALTRDDPDASLQRLADAVEVTGGDPEAVRTRVRPVRIELSAPLLGLPAKEFQALADELTAIWHCAALAEINGDRAELDRNNVDGTRHILELAEVGALTPRLFHVSTAYVAGLRNGVTVAEDDLDDSAGFAAPYEESKYCAEVLVRNWSHRTGRKVAVLRPSVMITDRPATPGQAGHTLSVLGRQVARLAAKGVPGFDSAANDSLVLHIAGTTDATLNFLQVEYAVEAMLAVARAGGTGTFHITHPVDTPLRDLLDAIEAQVPGLRLHLGEPAADATLVERLVSRVLEEFFAYLEGRRRYDRTRLLSAVPGLDDPAPIDHTYLRAVLKGAEPAVRH